jgi:hypothetical protein
VPTTQESPAIETTPKPPRPWWLWPQVLSLDAPIIAVAWLAALAVSHRLHLPEEFYWGLGIVTWGIYLVDRTADACSGRLPPPLSPRHAFCLAHHRLIACGILPILTLTITWLALFRIPSDLVGRSASLLMLVIVYLILYAVRRQSWLHMAMSFLAAVIGFSFVKHLWLSESPLAIILEHGGGIIYGLAILGLALLIASALRGPDANSPKSQAKSWLAALLFTLGCSLGVHFWTPSEHGVFCTETWLLWLVVLLNLLIIRQAEEVTEKATTPLVLGPFGLMIAGLAGYEAYQSHSPLSMGYFITLTAVALALTFVQSLTRRLPVHAIHTLADIAHLAPILTFLVLMKN